jgi:hypothetical protein
MCWSAVLNLVTRTDSTKEFNIPNMDFGTLPGRFGASPRRCTTHTSLQRWCHRTMVTFLVAKWRPESYEREVSSAKQRSEWLVFFVTFLESIHYCRTVVALVS